MRFARPARLALPLIAALALSACGGSLGSIGNIFGGGKSQVSTVEDTGAAATAATAAVAPPKTREVTAIQPARRGWFSGKPKQDPNTTIQVNKYIWTAALEVLNFLPVQSADPFTGVIVTGYGTPPGGGRAYRATIYVQDAALDARSLRLALSTRGGPVSSTTAHAVEDAILTRARQLRVAEGKL
jgi:hypothetical protein